MAFTAINLVKKRKLIEGKEKEGLRLVAQSFSKRNDMHIIFFRPSDSTYIVWTSYYNGDGETSYRGFYNGTYDIPTVEKAYAELDRRCER